MDRAKLCDLAKQARILLSHAEIAKHQGELHDRIDQTLRDIHREAAIVDPSYDMTEWEAGYDQAIGEVLSELDQGTRARLRLKFRGWDKAWRERAKGAPR